MKKTHHQFGQPLKQRIIVYLALTLAFFIAITCINLELPIKPWELPLRNERFIADSLLLAYPVLFIRRKGVVCAWIVLVLLFLLSQTWYLRNYDMLMPFSSYLMVQNLHGLGPSILHSMSWRDLLIVTPAFIFLIAYFAMNLSKAKVTLTTRLLCAVIPALFIAGSIWHSLFRPYDVSHPHVLYSFYQTRGFQAYGFINYAIYEATHSENVDASDREEAEGYLRSMGFDGLKAGTHHHPEHRRNFVLILLESFQSWLIGLEIDGKEVTPNINRLIERDSTLYFPNVLSQTKHGRSSDCHLMVNTGLLPTNNVGAAYNYGNNSYPSLAKALKRDGYTSANLTPDNRLSYNCGVTSRGYGFDELHTELARGSKSGRDDEKIFERADSILSQMRQPFYAQIATYSGHDMICQNIPNPFNGIRGSSDRVKNHINISHFVDSCVGDFVRRLEARFDSPLIVITGDHDFVTLNEFENRKAKMLTDKYVPLIILNSHMHTEDTDSPIGQVDIYPSLLELTGQSDYGWQGFGHSVFAPGFKGAVYADGHVGELSEEEIETLTQRWRISDILIRSRYFNSLEH